MRVDESAAREIPGHQTIERERDDHYFHQHQLNKHSATQRNLTAKVGNYF